MGLANLKQLVTHTPSLWILKLPTIRIAKWKAILLRILNLGK